MLLPSCLAVEDADTAVYEIKMAKTNAKVSQKVLGARQRVAERGLRCSRSDRLLLLQRKGSGSGSDARRPFCLSVQARMGLE